MNNSVPAKWHGAITVMVGSKSRGFTPISQLNPVGASKWPLLAIADASITESQPTKNPAHLSMCGVFREAIQPYGAFVSSSSAGTLKSRDIMTLRAVMVKIENTNSLRAQTVSSTAL